MFKNALLNNLENIYIYGDMKGFRRVKEESDINMGLKIYVKESHLHLDEIKITKLMSLNNTLGM